MKRDKHQPDAAIHNIPDIDIIDLEQEDITEENIMDEDIEEIMDDNSENIDEASDNNSDSKSILRKLLNVHVLFVVAVLCIIGFIVFRINNWGVKVDLNEIFKDGQGSYDDSLDEIIPLLGENGEIIVTDDVSTIVAFGNAPFADDRDSEDNLANLIAQKTGTTVYNCSISGSYLASQSAAFDSQAYPMDAYCFYWLVTLATGGPIDQYYTKAAKVLGDDVPPEAAEVYETLKTLDFNTVDVITVMYDATDYLMGNAMYSDENPTDIQQFTGNLEAGIELLKATYPHIRIIVMSPTYAYAVDQNGDYISSDKFIYNERDVLSTYSIKEYASCVTQSVSFVDHLYGTITEDNADKYLIDNLHLNVEGRKLVADRFEYFLNYYSKGYADTED